MFENKCVAVVIPALNEERAIAQVLREIPDWVDDVVVVDNGSTDATGSVARAGGARVVLEEQQGYGAACLTGLKSLDAPDIVVFLDADLSDHPKQMDRLVAPIARDEVDLVIGSRVLGDAQHGALTPQQRWGNALACRLMRLFWKASYTDLGPFRAISYPSLCTLQMDDQDYGWTVQMQIRAAKRSLTAREVPVDYRRRVGKSKISGTIRGVLAAGTKILSTIAVERRETTGKDHAGLDVDHLLVFTRYPVPGKNENPVDSGGRSRKSSRNPARHDDAPSLQHRRPLGAAVRARRSALRRRIRCANARHIRSAMAVRRTIGG